MKQTGTGTLLILYFYWLMNLNVEAMIWNRFASSVYYSNVRLFSELSSFTPRYFPKEKSLGQARMDCSLNCASNKSCYAFNLYPTDSTFVCELLADNFCFEYNNKALYEWPDSEIWDKLNTSMIKPCLETRYPSADNIPCSVVMPGCLGTWPNCSNCVLSCKDCYARTPINGHYNCTIWPEGPSGPPIFGACVQYKTFLIKRTITLQTPPTDVLYRMSFYDMARMTQLNDPSFLGFHFVTSSGGYYKAQYTNFSMDSTGTFYNLTLAYPDEQSDIFKLKTRALGPIPFVSVADDRYGCGSFWLVDPNNATYCPGGGVSVLGPFQKNGNLVLSTGIRHPAISSSDTITFASVELR